MSRATASQLGLSNRPDAHCLPVVFKQIHLSLEIIDTVFHDPSHYMLIRGVAYLGHRVAAILSTITNLITLLFLGVFGTCCDPDHRLDRMRLRMVFACVAFSFLRLPVIGEVGLLINLCRRQTPERVPLDR